VNLAEAVVKVVGDFTGLRSQVQAEGDRAAQTFGQRFRSGTTRALGAGLAIGGAALGAAAAVGTRGVIELDNAMADYQATTGATVEETARAAETTEELFRGNLGVDSYREAAEAQAALRSELGLSEDQIDDVADSFVNYARVTGQDTVGAIESMDGILDAWNLNADDSGGIMDQLVRSHQLYGGSVEENAGVLQRLAPQLQAANMGLDDGVGLLNLLAASGIDASKMPQALTQALSKIESPEELQQMIDEIAGTEDAFDRARLATELFGPRAGPQLAAALDEGIGGLDDYKISADEAAGATDTAAEAIDSSFGRQAQLWIRNIQGMATDMVQNLGPGIGGVAMAASTLAPSMRGLFGLLRSGATGAIPLLLGAVGKIGPMLSGLALGPVGIIVAAVAGLFLAWQTNFLGIRDIVANVFAWITDVAVPWITTTFGMIVSAVSSAVGLIVDVVGTIIDVIAGVFGWISDVAVGSFETAFGAIKAVIETVVGTITGIISGITGVVSTVAEAVGGLFDFITGGTSAANAELHGVTTSIPKPSAPTGNLGSVPKYAEGTPYVPSDQLAYLHRGEAVLPADAAAAWRGGGDTYVVNVQGLVAARSTHEIADGLRELGEHGRLTPPRRRFANA
jgi:hypothetical protein